MAKVNWRSLAASLHEYTEDEVKRMLDEEMATHRRPIIAKRLHQRFAALRTTRERAEIMAELGQ